MRALAIREKALGKDHPDVAAILNALAMLYKDLGDYGKALPLNERAYAIYEKALGNYHLGVVIMLNDYADWLEDLGKTKEAAAARARAKKIQDRIDRKSGK